MVKGRRIIPIILILAASCAVFFVFGNQILDLFLGISRVVKPVQNITDKFVEKMEKKISAPEPLKSEENAQQPFLSRSETIKWTNIQREKYGLAPLKENSKLDYSAGMKVDDMFDNQYFEHVSPGGVGVDNLAQKAGYDSIIIGENLAMGNFENSGKLVEAWMASPGHRENILNAHYTEIGVAVMENFYEGRKIWMAVQHFALPSSYCPKPDESFKNEIESGEKQIDQLGTQLEFLYAEINKQRPRTKAEIDAYNQIVNEYNSILAQYNLAVAENKNLIDNYNNQVILFNQCLVELK